MQCWFGYAEELIREFFHVLFCVAYVCPHFLSFSGVSLEVNCFSSVPSPRTTQSRLTYHISYQPRSSNSPRIRACICLPLYHIVSTPQKPPHLSALILRTVPDHARAPYVLFAFITGTRYSPFQNLICNTTHPCQLQRIQSWRQSSTPQWGWQNCMIVLGATKNLDIQHEIGRLWRKISTFSIRITQPRGTKFRIPECARSKLCIVHNNSWKRNHSARSSGQHLLMRSSCGLPIASCKLWDLKGNVFPRFSIFTLSALL